MIDKETLAGKMYDKYCQSVGGKAFNGDALPNWKTFQADTTKLKQSNAWVEAADVAIDFFVNHITSGLI